MRRTITIAVPCLLLVAGPAQAAKGHHYVAETMTTGSNMKQPDTVAVEAWVEGANAKVVFTEAGETNPLLGEGKYILTHDGGETLYLVDPEAKTHARFDMNQLVGFVGAFAESGMLDMTVSNHSIEELDRGDGPDMHGYDTDYYKFRTTYDLEVKVLGIKGADHYVMESETWSVEDLQASGFNSWLQPKETGFEAVDTLIQGEVEKIKGFAFKSVVKTTTEGKKKKRATWTTSATEVTEFESVNVDNSIFELDPASQEISLVALSAVPPEGEEAPEEEEKGGFMKRLKKLRKGDG